MTLGLGIDLGTSGVRAALVDDGGAARAIAGARLAPEHRRDPAAWWDAVQDVIVALGTQHPLREVRAVAVDGTSGTVLPVDGQGKPLAPASLYNECADEDDIRAVAACADADSAARGATSPLARLLRWRGMGAARVVHEADYLAARLLGRPAPTDENNALKTGYDPRRGAWPEWVRGLAGPLLPDVVPAGTPLGMVGTEAVALGLPAQARVVAGTTDGCAAFLATGATAGEGVSSLGSTLTLKILADAPIYAPEYGIYSHRLQGRWLAGGASNTGGAALSRHFSPDALAALSRHIDPTRDSGFDYYPLPAPGERFPLADPALAPRELPRPAEDERFLHGLLEGIARIEALGYRRLAELGAPVALAVRSVGGGAANPVWAALRERILGVPLRPARSEEAAIGTATLALSQLTA